MKQEQLNEYLKFKKSLDRIKEIKKDVNYDKKYFTLNTRDYFADFGLFKVSYYAGVYGSSSVHNELSGLQTEEGKTLFVKFMNENIGTILDKFEEFYKKELTSQAQKQKERLEQAIQDIDDAFKESPWPIKNKRREYEIRN